jgi:Xaa-Pro aminopeptidase
VVRRRLALLIALLAASPTLAAQSPSPMPFGTLREQAQLQQAWLRLRLDRHVPMLLREHGVGCWVVPMREYNEDPVFRAIVAPTTFAARRRTIYIFCDRGAAGVERLVIGGSGEGGLYRSVTATTIAPDGRGGEWWGDAQWLALREVLAERDPQVIAVNRSRTFAFADGLSSGEWEAMQAALGEPWVSRIRSVDALPVDLIALRLPEEEAVYRQLQQLVWELTQRMFSREVITPGVTRTSDLVWWWREEVRRLGLQTWFQPSIRVQRDDPSGVGLEPDPIIMPGDLLWCDVGIVALGLHTDTQHNAYVLKPGESEAPAGLQEALRRSNRLQDLLFEEIRPARTGNEVLSAVRARMQAEGLDGTVYTHPIGLHGHGAGATIGLWDHQDGVPGRGDHPIRASTWYSSELQVTTPVPEWGNQPVRMAQEEDFLLGADGLPRWFHRRQAQLFLVR